MLIPVYAYFGYPAILFVAHAFRKSQPVHDLSDDELPAVTMVVAAYNEAAVIADKVRNFLSLEYPPDKLGLIIGSDGSSDNTAALALEAAAGNKRIMIIDSKERRGKVNVISDIIPRADTPIVVISDANTMYQPNSIRKLVRHFADDKVGAVCGRLLLTPSIAQPSIEENVYWKYETFIKRLESDIGCLSAINGQVFALRRDLFEPPPPDTITEDQYLGLRIMHKGFRIHFEPLAVVSEPVGSIETEHRRRLRISAGNFQTLFRAGLFLLNPLRGFPAFAYVSHKVLRWMVPLAMLLVLALNTALINLPGAVWLLTAQAVFYSLAALPAIISPAKKLSPLRTIHYFVSMNITIARGFFRFLFLPQRATWERTHR
jgi:cellulose synthase/poly-beta-1,6-N-acetylglucosamine synthase-like glycosyltransferase